MADLLCSANWARNLGFRNWDFGVSDLAEVCFALEIKLWLQVWVGNRRRRRRGKCPESKDEFDTAL